MLRTPFPTTLDCAALSSPGRVRDHNEDAMLDCPELGLWAIADGMGGHQRGEVASALALQTLQEEVAQGEGLEEAIHTANQAILQAADGEGMGTTLVAAQFDGALYRIAWVGDSRAYRVSADAIEPLSRDHSWVQAMIDAGQLDADAARNHPRRNVIFQCLGREESLEVGVISGTLQPDEVLLLCSDGLSGELTDAQIHEQCLAAASLEDMVAQLVRSANDAGGRDNISCIVLAVSSPPSESRPKGLLDKLLKPLKP